MTGKPHGVSNSLVIGVMGLVVLGIVFAQAIGTREDDIANCDRTSAARVSELHQRVHLVEANTDRIAAEPHGPTANANRQARRRYARDLLDLVDSQRAVALEPDWHPESVIDVPPDESVIADCAGAAYPLPWPLG